MRGSIPQGDPDALMTKRSATFARAIETVAGARRPRRNAAFPASSMQYSPFTAFGHIARLVNDAGLSAKSRGDLFDVAAEWQTA